MSCTPEHIAQVCHEANRALQCIANDPAPSPHWEEAPDWQRNSAIKGVLSALEGATPGQQHESWCEAKLADGWVWGPVKDPEAKEHPSLMPYARLSEHEQRKDALFLAVVAALS